MVDRWSAVPNPNGDGLVLVPVVNGGIGGPRKFR